MKYITLTTLIAIALLNCACSEDQLGSGPEVLDRYSGAILIWNLSQFELRELYTHNNNTFERGSNGDNGCDCDDTSDNPNDCNNDNQLCEFLQPDTAAVIQWGYQQYVSVVREKTEGGFLLGLTTHIPPSFTSGCSVLIVFDDGFRALVGLDEAEDTEGFPGFPPDEIDCP